MALEEAGIKLIAEGINVYVGDLRSAENATNGFVDATDKGSGKINAASSIITGALEKIGHVAVDAFLQAGRAALAFVGDSINLAGDFEAGMLEFQSVAGKSVDTSGLEEFRDIFIDIGKRLPVSTSDVQQAAIEMVKGGIDPATIAAGGLEQNIQFAAAAMKGDLVKAAEISSKIMGGWAGVGATAAEKSEFLAHATDLLARAANASSTDVEGLSLGIFNAQGIARTAGVSFDDLTTTLGALAPRFESSSVAGNSLKNMIARLQPTTKPATAAMIDLGLYTEETGSAFYDAQGNFIGFEASAQLLQDSLAGLTKEQQALALQQIFGNDAMGAAAGLAELGAAGYQEMADALANANGVADAAALKQQGLNTAMDNAKGSVEALQITIGSALSPILEDLLNNVVSPAINTLTDFAAAVFGSDLAFERLSPELQAIADMIDTVVLAVENVIGAFEDAGAGSSEFAEALGGLASDLGLPGDLIQDLVLGLQDLVKWFGDGGAESDKLGNAIGDLSGIWEKAGQVVDNVMAGYQDIIDSVLPQVQAFIAEHGDEISAFFDETWNSIIEIVNLALDLYNEVVPPVLHAIAGFIDEHGSEIQRIFGAVWDTITTLISGALDLIKGVITTTLALIRGDWEGVWTGLEDITKAITDTISGVIEGFLNIIAGFFDTSLDEIATLWENNWNQLVDIATQTDWAQVGRDVVDGIISGLAGAWSSLVGWITDRMSNLVDAALDAIGAGSPAKEWMPVGEFSVTGIMRGFSDMWPALTKLVDSLGDDLVQQAKDLGGAVQNAIADSFSSTASIDRQIAKNLDSFAEDVLPQYEQYTAGALKQVEQEARAFLDPTEGARYFKFRSEQILEYAKLQKELAETEDYEDRERLKRQMLLINAAQSAELNAFNANLNASESGIESLMGSIQAFLMSQGEDGENALPGVLENDIIRQITGWMNQLTQMAAALPRQLLASNVNNTSQRTYNMPIYTNQSPGALQDSMAIMGAMYP